jgi:DNA helicase-2/ATP-dependent DNA helicase PcrA
MMKTTEKHDKVLSAAGHLLVTGGPGSGKTTISILKAADVVDKHIRPGQRVLFLSFARATVSRIIEAIEREHKLLPQQMKRIHVETYHAFFWRILKTHGYLIGLPRRLSILLPQSEAVALSAIRNEYGPDSKLGDAVKVEKKTREDEERNRLASEAGRVCFDLFAPFAARLLHGSQRLRKLVTLMYPYVILDEFQDTNADQWSVVRAIASHCTLCALGDPEQRIYHWIGADPQRLDHFREACAPEEVDFGDDNHRSKGTEICMFGDDVLRGRFRQTSYNGIEFCVYESNQNQALTKLITTTLAARKRLTASGRAGWSLAILTPTKKLTRMVSDSFRSPLGGLPTIRHTAAIEVEGAILAAELLAYLMQTDSSENHLSRFVAMLCDFYRGKGGDAPSKAALAEADRIDKAYSDYLSRLESGRSIRGNSLLVPTFDVYTQARAHKFSGNPDSDWLAIRNLLDGCSCNRLKEVAEELRNIRLLERGAQLRHAMSQDWRDNGAYVHALDVVRQTFVQEHFAMARRPETGVLVMNMHKAKGKQFDEVIVFDGWPRYAKNEIVSNPDRIVRGNLSGNADVHARQNFRVSVTRGKSMVMILTPRQDRCILLVNGAS